MRWRSVVLAFSGLALLAPATRADDAARGALTFLSRPAGAQVRLRGPQDLAGRTPLTLDREAGGRYRITGAAPGYETWRRTMVIDVARTDTVWMALRRKSPLLAGLRSTLFPGWGQFYEEHPVHGWTMLLASSGATATLVTAAVRYRDKLDLYEDLARRYSANPTPQNLLIRDAAFEEQSRAYDFRRNMVYTTAAVWGLNVLDALVFGPPRPPAGMTLGIVPGISPDGAAMTAKVEIRF
jgi:hypothetical protein